MVSKKMLRRRRTTTPAPAATATVMKKKTAKNVIARLPQDLVVDIVARLAATSPSPLADLRSVRATCRSFREASAARDVGRRVRMGREQSLRWSDREKYMAALESCASAGNSDASFLLGLEYVFCGRTEVASDDDISDGLQLLEHADDVLATYAFGMLLFGMNDGFHEGEREWAVDVLNDLEDSLHGRCCSHCTSTAYVEDCRRKVSSAVRDITMEKFYFHPQPAGTGATCGNSSTCGKTSTVKDPADVSDWSSSSTFRQQEFCSPLCRWRDEYSKFFDSL